MRLDRKFFSVLLAAAMVMSMLLPVSAAQIEAAYGEASYYDIAVEAYSRMLAFHDGVVGAANQDRRYGLITSTGEIRVNFQYDGIWYLADNMFSVKQNRQYGIITSKGEELLPINHREITIIGDKYLRIDGEYYTADQSLTPVSDDEVYGYGDDEMQSLAESLGYDWMYPAGLMAFNRYIAAKYSNSGYTYYLLDGDNDYQVLLNAEWIACALAGWSVEGTLFLTNDGVYDGNGDVVYDAAANGQRISEEDYYYNQHSGAYVIVETTDGSLKGIVGFHGEEIIPCEYQRIGNESGEGYIGAVKSNSSGFVDSDIYQADGTKVKTITNTYVATEVYYRHMAFQTTEDGLNGLMDVNENILIPAQYDSITVDSNDHLLVRQGDAYYDGTYGLYTQDGRIIFDDRYETITYLDGDCYKLRDNGRYGMMDTSGRTVIPFDYLDMRVHTTQFIELYDGSRYKIVDLNNNTVVRESNSKIALFRPLYYDFETDLSHVYNRYSSWPDTLPFCIRTSEGYATVYASPKRGETSMELAHRTSGVNEDDMFAYQDDITGLFGFGKLGASDVIVSGYCGKITDQYPEGENLAWTLTSDGTLTISGTGEMADYNYVDIPVEGTDYSTPMPLTPWKDDLVSIKRIIVEKGVTSIGDWAFAHCKEATDIVIPDGITSIGNSAFLDCDSLISLVLPDSVAEIDYSAFINCSKLNNITLSANLPIISTHLFAECKELTSITIRQNVIAVQGNAFRYSDKLSDVYYSGTIAQWREIDITELGNESLLAATIHCTDGDINPKEDDVVTELPQGVKFVPYYYAVEENSSGFVYRVSKGQLPKGIALDVSSGELHGVPMEYGTFEFVIERPANQEEQSKSTIITVGNGQLYRQFVCKLTIKNNTNSDVQRPNDYEIIENVGTQDPRDPNNFYMEEYRDETFAIDGPYQEFYRLLIDGVEKTRDVDYTVREGSTIITVRSQTFRNVGEGTHTIAAEFRGRDTSGKTTVKQVAQNYTLNIRRPSDNTSSSSGSSSSSSSNYSITLQKNPNCTIKVSPSSASADTRVTLTVKPNTGYVLSALTVTGPNGKQIALTQEADGKYTFRMPKGKVDISAQVEAEQPAPVPAGDTPFVDMLESDWFYSAVVTAYQRGLMVGTSANTFSPQELTSRGMIVSVLHRLAGQPPAVDNAYFSDVPLNQYYAAAAAWAAEQGIVTGYGDGRFGPADDLTREQIVMILYNYARRTGMDTAAHDGLPQFTDLDQLSSGAREAMSWAYAAGLISGCGDGTLNPAGPATRAELAAFLVRFTALVEKN